MKNTLMLMKSLINKDLRTQSDTELIREYQVTFNPAILATLFERHYKFMCKISAKYWSFSDEDKASICLERLDTCMVGYNFKHKFMTVYGKYLYNEFRMQTQALNYDKRKINTITESYDEILEAGFDRAIQSNDFINQVTREEDEFTVLEWIDNSDLTEKEKMLCELIVTDDLTEVQMRRLMHIRYNEFESIKSGLKQSICREDLLALAL